MPRAGPAPRRPSIPPSCSEVNSRIGQSNETLNMFLGGRQRAWMTAGVESIFPSSDADPSTRRPRQLRKSSTFGNARATSASSSSARDKGRESASTSTSPYLSNVLLSSPNVANMTNADVTAPGSESQGSSIPSPPLSPDSLQPHTGKHVAAEDGAGPCVTLSMPLHTEPTLETNRVELAYAAVPGQADSLQGGSLYGSRRASGSAGASKRASNVVLQEQPKRFKSRPPVPGSTSSCSSAVLSGAHCPVSLPLAYTGDLPHRAVNNQDAGPSQHRNAPRLAHGGPTGMPLSGSDQTIVGSTAPQQSRRAIAPIVTGAAIPQLEHPIMPSNARHRTGDSAAQPLAPVPPNSQAQPGLQLWLLSDNERITASEKVQSFLKTLGGRQNLDRVTQLRVLVVVQAIERADPFYLLVHQIICLLHVNAAKIPSLLTGIVGFQAVTQALDDMLAGTSTMPYGVATFFSEFPSPIESYPWENPQKFAQMVDGFTDFVRLFNQNWQPLIDTCTRHQLPPLAKDMYYGLGIHSQVLMTVVFRAVLRRIWGGQPTSNSSVNDIFERAVLNHEHDFKTLSESINRRRGQDNVSLQLIGNHYQLLLNQLQALTWPVTEHSSRSRGLQGLQSNVQSPISDQNMPRNPPTPLIQSGIATPTSAVSTFISWPPQTTGPNPNIQRSQPVISSTAAQGSPHTVYAVAPHTMPTTVRDSTSTPSAAGHVALLSGVLSHQSPLQQSDLTLTPAQRLFPLPGQYLQRPAAPQEVWALHQAQLRSPSLLVHSQSTEECTRYFQSMQTFALLPARLKADGPCLGFSFDVSDEQLGRIPETRQSADGSRSLRFLGINALQYRLRMCKIAPVDHDVSSTLIGEWGLIETAWARNISLKVNERDVELRRKSHYARDLPVDITDWIRLAKNKVEILINAPPNRLPSFAAYAVAVEIIGIQSLAQIKAEVAARLIPAVRTVSRIKQKLASSNPDSDDELMMVSGNLTIQLIEPFSNRDIFATPVRGVDCSHFECFDLDIWLQSRPLKQPAQGPSAPSSVDCWRCPICRGDARPGVLVVDGFLVEVRQQLREQGLLDTRHIVVEQDGSWKPKVSKSKEAGRSRDGNRTPNFQNVKGIDPCTYAAVTTSLDDAEHRVQTVELN